MSSIDREAQRRQSPSADPVAPPVDGAGQGADAPGEPAFEAASEEHQARERARARELRRGQWWKGQLGRGQCHYCQRRVAPRELTMDHIVPIIRGGRSVRGNVVPCCQDCNAKKRYLLPVEWQEYLARVAGG